MPSIPHKAPRASGGSVVTQAQSLLYAVMMGGLARGLYVTVDALVCASSLFRSETTATASPGHAKPASSHRVTLAALEPGAIKPRRSLHDACRENESTPLAWLRGRLRSSARFRTDQCAGSRPCPPGVPDGRTPCFPTPALRTGGGTGSGIAPSTCLYRTPLAACPAQPSTLLPPVQQQAAAAAAPTPIAKQQPRHATHHGLRRLLLLRRRAAPRARRAGAGERAKPLGRDSDIFMYRGDTPFCSDECRHEQIQLDTVRARRDASRSTGRRQRYPSSGTNSPNGRHQESGKVSVARSPPATRVYA
jgi:hypothetical protein